MGVALFFGGNDENQTDRRAGNRAADVPATAGYVRTVLEVRRADGTSSAQPTANQRSVLRSLLPLLRARGGDRLRTITRY